MQMQFNANDFCYGRAKMIMGFIICWACINLPPDKFELYEIIREKQNDEESKIRSPGSLVTADVR